LHSRNPSIIRPSRYSRGTPAGGEFGAEVGSVRGEADTQDQSPLADLIQCRDLVREQYRITQRWQQYGGAKFDPWDAPGHPGEQYQRFVAWAGKQGISNPDRGIAQRSSTLRQRQQRLGFRTSCMICSRVGSR
jgi:hypothetical protein